jgi:hypothetical protein
MDTLNKALCSLMQLLQSAINAEQCDLLAVPAWHHSPLDL